MTPTLSQIIMGFVGLAVTFLGVVLSQIGKRGDQTIQQNKDQFQRLLEEARYWEGQSKSTRNEWEARWDRQMERCRKITDEAYVKLTELMHYVPLTQRRDTAHVLDDIEQHRQDDHPEQ